jgi:RNA-directed DNA polymerase
MSNFIAWKDVTWPLVNKRVNRLQRRIFKASQQSNKRKIRYLQKILVNSLDAKLLAVRRVTTENKGKRTAGVDEKVYLTPQMKGKLIRDLRVDGVASPILRVWIPKPSKNEKRPLGVPTIKDRAKQVLLLFALEPEWEAKFEPGSYGFRPGRSCHDAVRAIYNTTHSNGSNYTHKYVLDADLKGCFDNISHSYLLDKLDTLPEFRVQIKAWLEAGIIEGYLNPADYATAPFNVLGTPQGGASPFLANVALHGMEEVLKDWIVTKPNYYQRRGLAAKQRSLTVVRYADDFVVIHAKKEVVNEAKDILSKWLSMTSRLTFNEEKTNIYNTNQGFDFLGHRFINVNRNGKQRIKIYPTKKACSHIQNKIRDVIQHNKTASSYDLIKKLRPIILGWANYYKYSECSSTFGRMDNLLFQKLRAWTFRRDRRHGRTSIKEKYFPSGKTYVYGETVHRNNWILFGKAKDKKGKDVNVHLPRFSWVASLQYIKVKGTSSPYDGNDLYWARTANFGKLSASKRKLFLDQQGKCLWCSKAITAFDTTEVDHIRPTSCGGKDNYGNLELLHKDCHVAKNHNVDSLLQVG